MLARELESRGLPTVLVTPMPDGAEHLPRIVWPEPRGAAYKSWQPAEPSPIVKMMLAAQKK